MPCRPMSNGLDAGFQPTNGPTTSSCPVTIRRPTENPSSPAALAINTATARCPGSVAHRGAASERRRPVESFVFVLPSVALLSFQHFLAAPHLSCCSYAFAVSLLSTDLCFSFDFDRRFRWMRRRMMIWFCRPSLSVRPPDLC
jgi:hypothetical protein